MRIILFTAGLLASRCLWGGYQLSYTDNLTSIDSTKWTQIGSLAAGPNGVTGQGLLLSKAAIPTGNDYDVRLTIHTATVGLCTGSYSLYARSTPDNTTSYVLTINSGNVGLFKKIANTWTVLTSLPYYCADGTVMRLVVRGGNITTWSGPYTATYQDSSPIATGQPGVGISSSDTIGNVEIGPIDYLPPTAVAASSVEWSVTPNRVDLRWPASVDDVNGAGLQGYVLYRDAVYLGTTLAPTWVDLTASPGTSTAYSIYAADQHGNLSAPGVVNVAVPEGLAAVKPAAESHLGRATPKNVPTGPSVDQREIGVRPTGSYYGAAGENIDLLSGNVNFSVPLIKSLSRDNWSVTFALSYNSQIWRQDSSGEAWLLGEDLGAGLGWTLQAGSILPVWYDGSVEYYQYTDATGAQYVLDQNNGSNVWRSLQGIYVWYDANANVLHFPDGSFWNMTVQSASSEQDSGTLYPSQMEDSNGNFIALQYGAAVGYQYWSDNSSRIMYITDARGDPNSVACGDGHYGATYCLSWSGGGIPHLSSILNTVGTSENYAFSTGSQTLLDPFISSNFGTATTLQSATVTGLNIGHSFAYDNSAEMTRLTTPLGGKLTWTYATLDYTARNYRGVWRRSISAGPSGPGWTFYIGSDGNPAWHGSALVTDLGAETQKSWTFSLNSDYTAGLVTGYEEIDTNSAVLLQKAYAWAQTTAGTPYVGTVTTTLNPGASYAASTTTNQTVEGYGNLTQQQVSDYSGSTTGNRTYNLAYAYQSNGQYSSRYLFNRLTSVTVTPSGGSPLTLLSTLYDASCGGFGLVQTNASNNWDSAYSYNQGVWIRGNPSTVSGLNGSDTVCTAVDTAGVPYYSVDASGHWVSLQTDSTTNYSLPTVIQPNGNSGMQTSASYASSWAVASMTGPNGDQSNTTYDSYGRPSQTTIPDGAVTTYTYTYSSGNNTQTATVDGRWQTTTLDGFGRTISVQKGNGSTIVSTVTTDYGACGCSPLGKMVDASEPYGPGGSPAFTYYYYDGSGRTIQITAPDGASNTTYSYNGNSTTVTDPAGKWKTSTVDAYGNLIVMTEPNPAGGTLVTKYTYTPANQLLQVSMTRGNVTQNRYFSYNGSDLVSSTNPENGTLNYTYDNSHHVNSRTDAIGNVTQFSYDSYGRVTEVQYYPYGYPGGGEDTSQQVTYYYDNAVPAPYQSNPPPPQPQNGIGRLTGVGFGGGIKNDTYDGYYYSYIYTYNTAGRVTNQIMTVIATNGTSYNNLQPVYPPIATFTAAYQWDNEGRMTSMQYPTVAMSPESSYPNPVVLPTAGYQYDTNGRLATMTMDGSSFASATYGAAGQMMTLSYGAGTETRTYNSMLQLTSQSIPGYLNMTYNYSASQNNGRITSSVDGMTSENTTYGYDALNRLTGAANSSWNESYGYDGFGNLTTKTGSGGSPNAAPSMSVSYDANNHQVGLSYDANGNVTYANGQDNGYNVENGLDWQYSNGGVTLYGYDPWRKRVMKATNGVWEFYFYGITGQRLVTMDCNNPNGNPLPSCWVVGQNAYFGSKLLVSNGVTVVTDRLGSVRANTQGESFAYYPYGEERTSTVDSRDKFGTYFRDGVGQDYADQRYYNNTAGSFMSPDPSMDGVDYENSTSWNAYAYVNGDPINFNDPSGLGPITLPPVVPGINCSTAFINYAAQFGESIQDLFNTDQGILGVMSYFEQQGSGSSSDEKVWAALDWTFINRWNLSTSDKAWFYGPGNAPASFAATVTTGPTRSQVFTSDGQLTAGFTTQLLNVLTGSPDSKQCAGLADAFDVASGVIEAANGLKTGLVTPIPDPYPGALAFGSNGAVPSHSRAVKQVAVGTIVDGTNSWTFFSDSYTPPAPVRRPPPRRH